MRSTHQLREAHECHKEHTKWLEKRLRKFRRQDLYEGDHVRLRLTNFQSEMTADLATQDGDTIFSPNVKTHVF